MDRRYFIKGTSAATLSIAGGSGFSAGLNAREFNWRDLLESIQLSKGKPLRLLYPQGCLANLKPIITVFEQLTGVKVEVKQAGFDSISNTMLKNSLFGKSEDAFDIAIPSTFSIPDLAEAGVIANLDSVAENAVWENVVARQSIQSLYPHGDKYQGSLYGLQSSGDAYLLFLKKSWLLDPDNQRRYQDQYGYALSIPRSWEELDRQMGFFHAPEKGRFGGCMFRNKLYMHWEFWIRMHSQGIYPFNRSMKPLISESQAHRALTQMKQASEFLHSGSLEAGPYENFTLFGKGNCYANLSWGGGHKYFHSSASQVKDDLIITQTPGIKMGNSGLPISYFNWGWSYVVAAKSEQQELAFLFILMATSSQYSGHGVAQANGFFDPFLQEHFEDNKIEDVYGKPFLEALQTGLARAIPDLYMAGQTKYFSALRSALYSSLYQNVPANLTLQAVADKWNEITENQGIEGQTRQWQRLQNKYPDDVKAVLGGF